MHVLMDQRCIRNPDLWRPDLRAIGSSDFKRLWVNLVAEEGLEPPTYGL